MKCPVCDEKMREVEKAGVVIDICPGCKGVWLDRGELEKLYQIAEANDPGYGEKYIPKEKRDMPEKGERSHHEHDDDDEHGHHGGDYDARKSHDYGGEKKKRKGSWLGDIFGAIGGGEGD